MEKIPVFVVVVVVVIVVVVVVVIVDMDIAKWTCYRCSTLTPYYILHHYWH